MTLLSLLLVPTLLFAAQDPAPPPAPPVAPTPQGGTAPQAGATPPRQGLPAGVTREQMWFAPTAADWATPCLVKWQRSWSDAVALSRETGKAILACVNMDGEIASEHYAGVRYRRPETAAFYEPYVCVIASVYRHTPRDHDENGARIPCPRFGTVTCGEHIAIEPLLFERFLDEKRIAPRHIMIELDQSEVYDVYYAWDTDTIFRALQDGIANRGTPPPDHRQDRPFLARVTSPDVLDREAIEGAWRNGTPEERRALLAAAIGHPDATPAELLRLAIQGTDKELAREARRALAKTNSPDAVELVAHVLGEPLAASEREALIAALARLGDRSPRAKMLAGVFSGLSSGGGALSAERWTRALSEPSLSENSAAPSAGRYEVEARLAAEVQAASARPNDPESQLALAESHLALALDPATPRRWARVQLADAQTAAMAAQKQGAAGWRLECVLALCAQHLGERDEAFRHAEAAVGDLPADASGANAAAVLAVFVEGRQRAIADAVRAKKDWPGEWMSDVHAAYSVLARHPLGTDQHVVSHHDFLKWFGARAQATQVLDEGLARYPSSWLLHDRLRGQILRELGVDGLEPTYAKLLAAPGAPASLESFAGYATLVAAEFRRRRGEHDEALAAYQRAIALYERWSARAPEERAAADHYVALALAGRARVLAERGEDEAALVELVASFQRRPQAAASLDGLNISPVDTARMLLAKLREAGKEEQAGELDAALAALDPELLRPQAYEREIPGGPSRDARRFGRRQREGEGPR